MKKMAVILAGGKGTRLRPYTMTIPKPLVPVGEKAILEIVLSQLKNQGFEKINIAVNHQAEMIMAYLGDGSKMGLEINYFREDKPLGTMGPLKNMDNLEDDFIVMNGDILSDINYSDFLTSHIKNKELFTISSYEREQLIDYGVLGTKDSILVDFCEKPRNKYEVSMGIYAVSEKILDYIPQNEFFGFDTLVKSLLEKKEVVSVKKYDGYWMDIGRPEDYEKAINDVESGSFKA